MELYRNTADLFINYLKRHGYPEECIALEYGNKQYAIDIAILARDMITPIAIYEIKGKNRANNPVRTGTTKACSK